MKKALLDSFIWRGVYFLTTILLNVSIARVYEASKSGWIYFISNNFYLVLLVGGLSLDASMTYFAASNRIPANKLVLFALKWSVLVAVFSVLCTAFLINRNLITSEYHFLFVSGVAYTFGVILTSFFSALFYSKHDFAVPNISLSVVNALVIILIPFFAKGYWGLNKEQFLYIYFLHFVLQGLSISVLYIRKYSSLGSLKNLDKQEYSMLFRFAFVALAANIAYYLINRIDYLFVEAWCSAKALGNYVQASKMGQLFLIIPTIISSAVYPHAARSEGSDVIKLILRIISLFIIFYVLIILFSLLFCHQLFIWMFGNTFDEMFVPYMILLPGILFLSIHIIIAAYFGGKNKPVYNFISTGAGLVIVLTGDFLLIKKMGITGAALVSSAGYITAFIVSLTIFMRMTSSNWTDIFSMEAFRLKTYTSFFANQTDVK